MRRFSLLHRRQRPVDEAGFAVPTTLLAVIAAFGLATAGVIASVNAQHGTVRDQDSKAAIAIAEAGVSNALLRFNRIVPSPSTSVCQPVGGTTLGADGWCPTQGTGTIDRGSYDYVVRPFAAQGAVPGGVEIVSTGTVSGVTRRVSATAEAITDGFRPFEGLASVIGLDGITLNHNSEIHADVATNGNIGLNNDSVLDCDFAQVGPGRGYDPFNNPADYCPLSYGNVSLPPVDPADVATNNSNGRICGDPAPPNPDLDPIVGKSCTSAWNPTTKVLQLSSNSAITLGSSGGEFNYAFCQVVLGAKSYIHIANGAKVRMYFLSPDSPPCLNQGSPLILSSRAKIDPTGSDATSLAILVVGSDTRATNIEFSADASLFSCEQSFVIYAPRTSVTLNNDTSVCGGIAAKSVVVNEGATVLSSNTADEFEFPPQGATHYGPPEDFLECSATPPGPTAAPDEGC